MVAPDTISKIFLPNLSTITTAIPVAITYGTKYERHKYTPLIKQLSFKYNSCLNISLNHITLPAYN